jgi:hypothetical protein
MPVWAPVVMMEPASPPAMGPGSTVPSAHSQDGNVLLKFADPKGWRNMAVVLVVCVNLGPPGGMRQAPRLSVERLLSIF